MLYPSLTWIPGPIQRFLCALLVKSGFAWYFFPLTMRYVMWSWMQPSNVNFRTVDDSGASLNLTKINGRHYPPFGEQSVIKIKQLRIRSDDVIICGYPKTGCHWTFEILRMLLKRTTSLSNYGKAFEGFLEALPEVVLDSLPSPRVLNTHVHYDELPSEAKEKRTKIILTTRCPKDTVVSFYHHNKNLQTFYGYDGSFDDYFKLFMRRGLEYGNYFDYTSDWSEVMTSHPVNPIFVLRYEQLKNNPVETIKKLATFLGIEISEQFAEDVSRYTDMNHMKKSREGNRILSTLLRKGIVGDWKNWLTEEQSEEIDAKMKGRSEQCL